MASKRKSRSRTQEAEVQEMCTQTAFSGKCREPLAPSDDFGFINFQKESGPMWWELCSLVLA